MKTILETERLLLREFVLDDVDDFFRMVSDPDVMRYLGDGAKTIEEARKGWRSGHCTITENTAMADWQPSINRLARRLALPASSTWTI